MMRVPLEHQRLAAILDELPRGAAVDVPAEVALVDFDPTGPAFLAVASDTVCEEVRTGLYADMHTVGWVLVMAVASDMAAAAADLLGVSTMLALPDGLGSAERTELARGIGDACRALGTGTLGGDIGTSPELVVGACAVGRVPKDCVLSRAGAEPGDAVYLSGPAGLGNAYALTRFDPAHAGDPFPFRPRARVDLKDLLRRYATCTMDTSDGVLATLDELARVNRVGMRLTAEPDTVLHANAVRECRRRHWPTWVALAGCHGEFEVAFTVRARDGHAFARDVEPLGLSVLRLGQVTREPGIVFAWRDPPTTIDTTRLRDLGADAATDVRAYIAAVVAYAAKVEA